MARNRSTEQGIGVLSWPVARQCEVREDRRADDRRHIGRGVHHKGLAGHLLRIERELDGDHEGGYGGRAALGWVSPGQRVRRLTGGHPERGHSALCVRCRGQQESEESEEGLSHGRLQRTLSLTALERAPKPPFPQPLPGGDNEERRPDEPLCLRT